MAPPLDRSWFNALVDDDGSGVVGTVWNKAQVDGLLDTVDAGLAPLVSSPVQGNLPFGTDATLVRTTPDGADTGTLAIAGGGAPVASRGGFLTAYGNEHASAVPGSVVVQLGDTGDAAGFRVFRAGDFAEIFTVRGGDGVVLLPKGQVYFPPTQNPHANPNTLDDYREFPWLPAWGGSGGQSGQSYTTQEGRGIKIGNVVMLNGQLALAALGTISGNLRLTGFPYPAMGGYQPITIAYWSGLASTISSMFAYFTSGQTVADVVKVSGGGATSASNATQADLTSSTNVVFAGFYFTT